MAAEKGNKYAVGNNGGRPPLYSDAETLSEKIDEYFSSDENKTITGLALYLGFESKQSLYDYGDKEEFSYLIKRARLTIENKYEESLMNQSPTGAIFALKNMGWNDKTEIDHTTKGEAMNVISLGKGINPNESTS